MQGVIYLQNIILAAVHPHPSSLSDFFSTMYFLYKSAHEQLGLLGPDIPVSRLVRSCNVMTPVAHQSSSVQTTMTSRLRKIKQSGHFERDRGIILIAGKYMRSDLNFHQISGFSCSVILYIHQLVVNLVCLPFGAAEETCKVG